MSRKKSISPRGADGRYLLPSLLLTIRNEETCMYELMRIEAGRIHFFCQILFKFEDRPREYAWTVDKGLLEVVMRHVPDESGIPEFEFKHNHELVESVFLDKLTELFSESIEEAIFDIDHAGTIILKVAAFRKGGYQLREIPKWSVQEFIAFSKPVESLFDSETRQTPFAIAVLKNGAYASVFNSVDELSNAGIKITVIGAKADIPEAFKKVIGDSFDSSDLESILNRLAITLAGEHRSNS